MYVLLPALLSLLGLVTWAVSARSEKPNEILVKGGEIIYKYGLLIALYVCATQIVAVSLVFSASIPIITMVAGLLIWVLSVNGVTREAGRLAFGFGFLVALLEVATHRFPL